MSEQKIWYYTDGENSIGPFTEVEMQALHFSGAINDDTLLCKAGDEQWQTFSSIHGIPDAPPAQETMVTSELDASENISKTINEPGEEVVASPSPKASWARKALIYVALGVILFGAIGGFVIMNRDRTEPVTSHGEYGDYPVIGESIRDVKHRFDKQLLTGDLTDEEGSNFKRLIIDWSNGVMVAFFEESSLRLLLISLGDTATAQGISSTDVAEDIATALSGRYNFQKHSNNIWIDSENELVIGIRGKELLIASTSALDQSPSSLKEFPGRILKAVQDVTESGDLTDQKVEYVDLISADAGKLTVEGKPVIGRGIENLRKILGAETKSKALEPTERVKAYLWAGVSSHTLGLSLTEEVTFNLEAHTFGEIIFMIIFRQMEGKNSYVTRPLDDAAAFALVQAVTGPYSRDRWESQKSDAKRSGGTYFLPGPGFYWLDTSADFRDERENGWWREVAVFEQARVVYGVRTVIPDWPGRGVGGALTE